MERTGEKKSKSYYLVHRISMAIQRGSAACILSAMTSDSADLHPMFYL